MVIHRGDAEAGKLRLGCLFSLLLVAAAAYFGFQYFEVQLRYYRIQDEVKTQASFGPVFDDATIRNRLAARADSLDIPLGAPRAWDIKRTRDSQSRMITITAQYDDSVVVSLPGVYKVIRFHFTPSASSRY